MSLAGKVKGAVFSGVAGVERVLRRQADDLSGIRNFLLLQYPTALGPAVHATPLVTALRTAVPDCRIGVAASGLALEVFRNHSAVDFLLQTPSPLKDLRSAVTSLRQQKPFQGERFAALTSCGNERTLIGIAGLLSRATVRVGFTEVPKLYRVALKVDAGLSLIDNNLRIVGALGHDVQHVEPEIFVTQRDVDAARQILAESGLLDGRTIAIFVTQNSGGQRTGWHRDRFVEVIRHASEKLGCAVVYVGTASDAAAIQLIQQAAGGAGTSIAGKTSVTQLAAVLAMSDVMVTLDTGTLHVGRAMKVPMVVLGTSWQKPLEWLPLHVANVRILRGDDTEAIPEGYQLDEITAGRVIAGLEELLRIYPPSSDQRRVRVERSLGSAHQRHKSYAKGFPCFTDTL